MKIKYLALLACAALSLSANVYCNDALGEISCGECGDHRDRNDREKNNKATLVSNDEAKNEQDAQDNQDNQDKTILVSNDEGSNENDSNKNGEKLASCNCPPEMIEKAREEKLNSQASEANLV